ncbi:PmoA family protein [Catenuloplanes niger JCM 9533]
MVQAIPSVDASLTIERGAPPVAEYHVGTSLPAGVAPRPYLHPVRTRGGTVVTELMPPSHRHHLGAGIAVPEVDGANFWGGRTFVPGHGPVWLDNHGTQLHTDWLAVEPDAFAHSLSWVGTDGTALLTERRRIAARPLTASAWALDVAFALTNAAGRTVTLRSPAVLGRDGAGYGGLFWRAPAPARAFGPAGDRITELHGTPAPWLALAGPAWTLVFAGADAVTRADPWFVRVRDYAGVGSALAWRAPLTLAPAATAARRFTVVVADGELSPGEAATLSGAA